MAAPRVPTVPRFAVCALPVVLAVLALASHRSWVLALAVAAAFVARGVVLNRPIVAGHAVAAAVTLGIAVAAHYSHHHQVALVTMALSGMVLMMPRSSHAQPERLREVAALVDRTPGDPLAPFVLHSAKSYFVNQAGTAAIGYRTRLGIAAVGGDPVGRPDDFEPLLREFSVFCWSNGWRIAVLGAGERCAALWRVHGLHPVPIGRDVVIDTRQFTMTGRGFRNLRQAVNRTRNAGLTTEVHPEAELAPAARDELMAIVDSARAGHQERGFSMILDHLLDGRHPGMLVMVARDATGRAVAFQRYGRADGNRMITMDVPWRVPDAPNGVDERMTVDMVTYAQEHGGTALSLAFAPFPEIFSEEDPGIGYRVAYLAVHLLDPLIAVESLYRFLRKFNALADRRYAMLRWGQLPWVLVAFLTLEFVPHRKRP
ncbi:DUF2156 domain-containing protein [Rhodococcus sp. D2-41]|uniref:Phosphatidylglycerol lysyltransferase domain-containing protein n=1 Tax=Speluncibacter jeojiensis TaxID=2710754 RepID=A0A9X4M3S0_9ACTN|nr:phosphatidylglycerol lysyltransferase domain-containing protein [Rhodococcus sp. D2-41]MDG3010916.1 DUF2156 domain-containing protein [Rhodococcus sp. D2-41]MDG3013891.1 phosphatidylglycerol lysyltransferase domain-containing protein [Corynebacteriales bacterium D3-21]